MGREEKLLERMRRSLSGWGQDDFATLYSGFGFTATQGRRHTVYTHKKYHELRATVARHNYLAKGYTEHAVSTIEKLQALQAKEKEEDRDA